MKEKHFTGIDGLRALACFCIVSWHAFAYRDYEFTGLYFEKIVPSWDYMVYLFMIISGFGLCCGYYDKVKNGKFDVNRFFIRRYKKSVPFFALVILAAVLAERSLSGVIEGLMEITMLFGFLPNNALGIVGVAWTYGVIFVFYLTFPYFVFLLWNRRRAWGALIASIVIQFMCALYFCSDQFVISSFVPRHAFIFCIPFFLMGGILYLYVNEICDFIQKHEMAVLGACIALTILYFLIPNFIADISTVSTKCLVLYTAWLCFAISSDNPILTNRFTKFFSSISMEIYLSHTIVLGIMVRSGLLDKIGSPLAAYILSVVVTIGLLSVGIPIAQRIINRFVK